MSPKFFFVTKIPFCQQHFKIVTNITVTPKLSVISFVELMGILVWITVILDTISFLPKWLFISVEDINVILGDNGHLGRFGLK